MSILKSVIAGLFVVGSMQSAHAELAQGDWLGENDGQAIIDTEQGLTWLSNTVTVGQSYNQVMERISNGDLVGWRVPTVEELNAMLSESFKGVSNFYTAGWLGGATLDERDQFRELFFGGSTDGYEYGIFEYNDKLSFVGQYIGGQVAGITFANGSHEGTRTSGRGDSGVGLVSSTSDELSLAGVDYNLNGLTDVPAPAIAAISLFGLMLVRRKTA